MTRTETDLRDALRDLERRADEHGAPSSISVLEIATTPRGDRPDTVSSRRLRSWLAPLAAAAVVVAATVGTVMIAQSSHGTHPDAARASSGHGAPLRPSVTASHRIAATTSAKAPSSAMIAATVLDDAATKLDSAPAWTPPQPQQYFYMRTTAATTWSSVSGLRAGDGTTADGTKITISGCSGGQLVSDGEAGACTLNDVPHYLADAPTTPAAWDAYLERIAPGAKAAAAQGKIIVSVLHQDLISPRAAAALLRYTAGCAGLHTVAVQPVNGENLIGVTCTSMTNGSYGIAFDAATHAYAGFVTVTPAGKQSSPAEVIIKTGIVPAIGRTP